MGLLFGSGRREIGRGNLHVGVGQPVEIHPTHTAASNVPFLAKFLQQLSRSVARTSEPEFQVSGREGASTSAAFLRTTSTQRSISTATTRTASRRFSRTVQRTHSSMGPSIRRRSETVPNRRSRTLRMLRGLSASSETRGSVPSKRMPTPYARSTSMQRPSVGTYTTSGQLSRAVPRGRSFSSGYSLPVRR
jgi:hypothetical protein